MGLLISDHRRQERRLLQLLEFKYDPTWRHVPARVEELLLVPDYTYLSKQPWLHLLDPRWHRAGVTIKGPFPGRRTIRTIHFALPRSAPPSFSRGITRLTLQSVVFRHLRDTACLLSELPDLQILKLDGVTWESPPTGLPRRRPRTNRNRLRTVIIADSQEDRAVESPSFLFSAFTLFPCVYAASSFFSLPVITAVEAALHVLGTRSIQQFNITHKAVGETGGRVTVNREFLSRSRRFGLLV